MQRWQGSCIGALLVLLSGGASLFFIVPVGGVILLLLMIAAGILGARLVKPSQTEIW